MNLANLKETIDIKNKLRNIKSFKIVIFDKQTKQEIENEIFPLTNIEDLFNKAIEMSIKNTEK